MVGRFIVLKRPRYFIDGTVETSNLGLVEFLPPSLNKTYTVTGSWPNSGRQAPANRRCETLQERQSDIVRGTSWSGYITFIFQMAIYRGVLKTFKSRGDRSSGFV